MKNDYEQKYYDALYEIKILKSEIKRLEEEKDIILLMTTKKSLKQLLSQQIVKYIKNKREEEK